MAVTPVPVEPVRTRPPPALDLRLVPAAVAAWAITAIGIGLSARGCLWITALCAVGTAVAAAKRNRLAAGAALACGCAAAAGVAIAVRVDARDGSPLRALGADRAVASVTLRLTGDPRPLRSGFGDRVAVPATATEVTARGHRWRMSAAVLVLAPAAGWSDLAPSQRVTVLARVMPADGADLTVAVLAARGPPASVHPPSAVQRVAGRLRAGLRTAARTLPADERGLLPGLVDGDVSAMSDDLTADFKTAGLTHLVAVSGANVAIVCGAVLLLVRRGLRLGPRSCAVVAALALVGFVILARPQPSVLRAAVMGALALLALATGRVRAALPALAGSVLVLVFISPGLSRSIGFALSVLATAALLVLAPPLTAALRRRGVPLVAAAALAVPVTAHLVTAPLIASISGRISLVAIPANLLAAPAVAPATVLGVLAAAVSPISAPAAAGIAWCAGWPTRWLVWIARHAAAVPGATVGWPGGMRGALLLAAAATTGCLLLCRSRPARYVAAAGALGAGLVVVPIRYLSPGWPATGWFLAACDVGEGDGLVLRAGPGSAVVVDTGTEPSVYDACLRRLHVSRIPLLVITHLHADHVGGVTGAMHGRQVGQIVAGPLHEPRGRLVGPAASGGEPRADRRAATGRHPMADR